MGSKKQQTVGYRYYMGLHFGLCHGPVDSVQQVRIGDRVAWQGEAATSQQINLDSPELFGGDKKEGGVQGALDVMMGEPTQAVNGYLSSKIGGAMPAFRGILSAVFRGGQVTANNPYVKPWSFKVKRVLQGWSSGAAWFPETAPIPVYDQLVEVATEIQPWVSGQLDPRNPVNTHEYRIPGGVWRTTPEAAFADIDFDALGEYRDPAATAQLIGWSLDGKKQHYPADIVSPGSAASLFLHFNRNVSVYSYYKEMQDSAGGALVCSSFFDESIEVNENRFLWWSGLLQSETDWPSATVRPGLYRLIPFGASLSGEVAVNNCTNYPASGGYFPQAVVTHDVILEVRRSGYIDTREVEHTDMNPAHIVYECLTNTAWGMGYPTSSIDVASFTIAADTLFAESFGLSMVWNQQETLENFIKTVLDHAGGILYVQPDTGKFALTLIRDDYDRNTLPVFGPSNLISASDYQRQAWGETINEVTVVYKDWRTSKDAAITVQDLANIQTQGGVVSQTRQYPGISNAPNAQRVALRDLNTVSTPLAKIRLTATRAAWQLKPGGVFRLSWPDYNIDDVVFRVLEVNRGTLQDGTITIEAAEDVFGLPSNTYLAEEPPGWVDPASEPQAAPYRKLIEAPYWDLARTLSPADLDYLDALSGYLQTLAVRPSGDAINYEVNAKVGAADYKEKAIGEFCPAATLSTAINKNTTAISFGGSVDVDTVTVGGYAYIGTEVVGISAIDVGAGTATITRGLLDTVPQDHANGARIWFADGFLAADQTEYASGETVDVKMLPRTGLGELAIALAPAEAITMAQRHDRPYPPGLFRIAGQAYPTELIDVALSATWAHRDRLQQTAYLVTQGEASIGPEAGTTYTVRLYDQDTGILLHQQTGISGTNWTGPALSGIYTLRLELEAVRSGLASWQAQTHVFAYVNGGRLTEGGDNRETEAGEVRSQE